MSTDISDGIKEGLFLTGLLMIVVDRTVALYAIRAKIQKITARVTTSLSTGPLDLRIISRFAFEYPFIQMAVMLLCYLIIGGIAILEREILITDYGRALVAAVGFILSVAGSILNLYAERVDMRRQQGG